MIVTAASALLALPAAAEGDDGPSLMEQGAQLFFEGLMREMEPAMQDLQGLAETMGPAMRSFMQEIGPALGDILDEVKDFSAYHAPEILPNGDIIMRKRIPDAPGSDAVPPEGEIDI